MKRKRPLALTAFIAWIRRYWGLVLILLLVVIPIIVLMALGVSLGEAIHAVSLLTGPVGTRGFLNTYEYDPSDDIVMVAITLVILAFIVFSLIRYVYKSKK